MFIDTLKEKAKLNKKTIILTEAEDKRVLEAIKIVTNENLANIIVVGNDINIDNVTTIDPKTSKLTEELINKLVEIRSNKGLTYDEAKKILLTNYIYYACMLLVTGRADGIVSGAACPTADVLRPVLQTIKTKEDVNKASSYFLIDNNDKLYLFADCAINQNPTSEDLAEIAKLSADNYYKLTGNEAKVALLSHSTLGSASDDRVDKVKEAVRISKEKYPSYKIDGEFQLDTAIVPEIASRKAPNNEIAGNANVLVFPDIDSANIGYKLVERFSDAKAYGPICQGINKPVSDLSRGCSVNDIVAAIVITAINSN